MAYQLLAGRFPFNDWAHPEAPALSLVSVAVLWIDSGYQFLVPCLSE
jgi:hypothetical protein